MFHVLFQSQIAVATGFMEETWSRNLLNVLTTPVTEVEYVAGTAMFGIAKVHAGADDAVGDRVRLLRLRPRRDRLVDRPDRAILTIVGWGVGVANIGVVLRFGQGAEILIWGTNFILMALSGVFNPVEALPGALQPIARMLPSTHAFTALRDVLAGEPLDAARSSPASSARRVPRRRLRVQLVDAADFRRRGFVTRFS